MTRPLTPRQVIAVLLAQGATIPCFRCKDPILFPEDAEREHLHEKALGGSDGPENARFSHAGCHAQVTFGSAATTAGSSIQRVAKTKGTRRDKFIPDKRPLDEPREKARSWNRGKSNVKEIT